MSLGLDRQTDSLERVQLRMRDCRLCMVAGFKISPEAVFSGPDSARVMVIGQAPGGTEVLAQRPFNAGSGKRLFLWLEAAGFEKSNFRSTQYLTSVTKCYPGKAPGGSGDRAPTRAEQELCRRHLDSELALVNPELIIPVGRLAINLFYPSSPTLDEIIGTEKLVDTRWIIPLPHPSGASRWHQLPENRALIDQAIERIRTHRLRMGL